MRGQDRLPFVQFELAGTVGLDEGRYLGRDPERVLVVGIAGAPAPPRRRIGRAKPKRADPEAAAATVPLTTLTAIRPCPLGDQAAAELWLGALRDDPEAIAAELADALGFINGAVHAQRTAVLDPSLADVAAEHALAVRIGFGGGEQLAEGRFTDAFEVPRSARRRRGEMLRPQERVAAVLGGRETVAVCELLVLRARSDLDAGRGREAALQLRVGLEVDMVEAEVAGRSVRQSPLAVGGQAPGQVA
ncbi:MAG: hypothetical protein ACRDLO_02350, partial [Solirubrobacterales bacterium]